MVSDLGLNLNSCDFFVSEIIFKKQVQNDQSESLREREMNVKKPHAAMEKALRDKTSPIFIFNNESYTLTKKNLGTSYRSNPSHLSYYFTLLEHESTGKSFQNLTMYIQ